MLVVKHKITTKLPIIEVENDMIVFEQGEDDPTMYLVVEGNIKLYVEKNGEEQHVATVQKHEFFGDNEMYTHTPRSVSARTTAPTKLVVIKSDAEFEQFVTENRWLSGKMMETMSEKLAEANKVIATKRQGDTKTNIVLEVKEDPNGKGGGARRIIRH